MQLTSGQLYVSRVCKFHSPCWTHQRYLFEAKLLEDIDTSFVENASLTWDTSSFNNDSWPTRQETVIKKTAEEVYKMLIQRSHRGSLLQLLFSLVARRPPFCELSPRGATSACEGIFRGWSAGCCSRSAWVVFVVLSYRRPHRILPFLFWLVSLECSPLCLQMGCVTISNPVLGNQDKYNQVKTKEGLIYMYKHVLCMR